MAKGNRNSGKTKQDQVISQFRRDIISGNNREWTTIAEKCINANKPKLNQPVPERISQYNPNNPLNGSTKWTKEQHQAFQAKQKAEKLLQKLSK